ncbi:MAG: hypothetical protein AB7V23_04645 [Candidatus Nanopelagicales bacterium]
MQITVMTLPGCPHADEALATASQVVRGLPGGSLVVSVVVRSEDEARELGFHGSPTFLLDGQDVFTDDVRVGFACRVYRLDGRLVGCPSQRHLDRAVRGALGR